MLRNVAQSAAYLGVGESTFRRWVSQGRVRIVRLGRRVLVREEVLKALIAAAEQPARTPQAGKRQVR